MILPIHYVTVLCCNSLSMYVQYQILMEFIESLERLTLADKFRKYNPGAGISKKGHYKEWSLLSFFLSYKRMLSVFCCIGLFFFSCPFVQPAITTKNFNESDKLTQAHWCNVIVLPQGYYITVHADLKSNLHRLVCQSHVVTLLVNYFCVG